MEVPVTLRWTGLIVIPLALGASVACEGGPRGERSDDDTGGIVPEVKSVAPPATQVGSEGFWDCALEELRTIAEPTEPIASLGGSPVELTAAHVGEWPLAIFDVDATAPAAGQLSLTDASAYAFADVTESAGCADHLVATVTATLTRDGAARAMSGLLAVGPDAARLLLTDDGDLAELAPVWGEPTLADAVALRLDADLDPIVLDGAVSYVDCVDTMSDCPQSELLAEIDGTR